jgi:hypothetical protein
LAAGTHYMPSTMVLGPQHSGLNFKPSPSAAGKVKVSGGALLSNLQWKAGSTQRPDLFGANSLALGLGIQ